MSSSPQKEILIENREKVEENEEITCKESLRGVGNRCA